MKHQTMTPGGRLLIWAWVLVLAPASSIATALVVGKLFSSAEFSQGVVFFGYAFGGAIDAAKLTFASMMLAFLWSRNFREALQVSVLAIPLVVGSIYLNLMFMGDTVEAEWSQKTQAAESSSLLSTQIAVLDRQIDSQQKMVNSFNGQFDSNIEASFRKYNVGLSDQLLAAQERLGELSDKRAELVSQAKESSSTPSSDIMLYGMEKEKVDLIVLLIAVLVDITAIGGTALLMKDRTLRRALAHTEQEQAKKDRFQKFLFSKPAPDASPEQNQQQAKPATGNPDLIQSVSAKADASPEVKGGDDDLVSVAVDLIFNKGVKPSINEIWKHGQDMGMSSKKAKRVLALICSKGLIEKNESGHYVVASAETA